MSAGELESGNAGEPAKLIRQRYREASDIIKKGRMSSLFINDLDAGAGRMGDATQYTVNNQMVRPALHLFSLGAGACRKGGCHEHQQCGGAAPGCAAANVEAKGQCVARRVADKRAAGQVKKAASKSRDCPVLAGCVVALPCPLSPGPPPLRVHPSR